MTFEVIYFQMPGLLMDRAAYRIRYPDAVGAVMAARWGADSGAWADAYRRIINDWDSYYADLDLTGDEAQAHQREGLIRTTRALFRLAGVPLPDADFAALGEALHADAAARCPALMPDAPRLLHALHARGVRLGAFGYMLTGQLRGLLHAGGVMPLFTAPIIGAEDSAPYFEHDAGFFAWAARRAGCETSVCAVAAVDESTRDAARRAGCAALDAAALAAWAGSAE